MASRRAVAQSERLRNVRDEFWPDADPWTGEATLDDGWFKAPRTLPLVLSLIRDKSPVSYTHLYGPVPYRPERDEPPLSGLLSTNTKTFC